MTDNTFGIKTERTKNNHSRVVKVFMKPFLLYFEYNQYTNLRKFQQFFVTKQVIHCAKKVPQMTVYSFEYNCYKVVTRYI